MVLQHVLAFSIAPSVAAEEQKAIIDGVLNLKPTCVKPDGKPYIRSIKGGKQNSKEGMDKGIQWVFLVEFENEEDRDYYVSTDPVHAALGKFLITKVGEISVFDFTEEVY
ncbi:stress responsive A/B barrel domain-containing protein [Schizophyllum amplum]|uniref:Stress responsive A/B barrel domain-containing protein n=1 Tax=Schizophyllum amplum TaxID=97359 RepID=A0A550BWJ1_9AGAR|nr:stress responsive A/B barrel domain-containing protein [Auriculariopsis ampla]